MAVFKVGQRVRIIGGPFVGHEGAVLGIWRDQNGVERPNVAYPWNVRVDNGRVGPYLASELAPLLPPDEAADQFIARIKKLVSEPVNDAPKERMTK